MRFGGQLVVEGHKEVAQQHVAVNAAADDFLPEATCQLRHIVQCTTNFDARGKGQQEEFPRNSPLRSIQMQINMPRLEQIAVELPKSASTFPAASKGKINDIFCHFRQSAGNTIFHALIGSYGHFVSFLSKQLAEAEQAFVMIVVKLSNDDFCGAIHKHSGISSDKVFDDAEFIQIQRQVAAVEHTQGSLSIERCPL